MTRLRSSILVAMTIATALVAIVACGRQATAADCELILDRSVELQMKEMDKVDPEAIAKRQAILREELAGEMKGCVGRSISDAMMTCVRNAKSSGELEKCVK
jgi:hypothetical protein